MLERLNRALFFGKVKPYGAKSTYFSLKMERLITFCYQRPPVGPSVSSGATIDAIIDTIVAVSVPDRFMATILSYFLFKVKLTAHLGLL